MTKSNQKGFTLVELSIVLVIIGLLIGGILAAQSMIETTKIQAFARQTGQFDAAVANFEDRFGGLPGDTSAFAVVGGTQDNGILDVDAAVMMNSESAQFWADLSRSGMKKEEGGGTYNPATGSVGNTYPRSKIGESGTGVLAGGAGAIATLSGAAANVYVVSNCTGTSLANCSAGITGAQAIAIDAKIDDGAGDTGNVGGHNEAVTTWATAFSAGEPYVVGTDVHMVIRMGLSTGVLK